MKTLIMVLALVVGFSANAQSVKEKKAKAQVEEALKTEFAKLKGCKMSATYDWAHFGKQKFPTETEKEDAYKYAPQQIANIVEGLNELCADKDYADAMKGTSSLVLRATYDIPEMSVKKEGNKLVIDDKPGYTRFKESYTEGIKAQF